MATKTLEAMQDWALQILQDTGGDRWGDDEMNLATSSTLRKIAMYLPNIVREIVYIVYKTGSATSTTALALVDATNAQFVAADVGRTVINTTDGTIATITVLISTSQVTIDTDIFESGDNYELFCAGGSDSRDIYIGGISDLTEVLSVEYKIGQDPRELRNFDQYANTLRLKLDDAPTTSESGLPVFVFCNKLHVLTASTSTLTPELERIFVELVAAEMAISKGMDSVAQIKTAVSSFSKIEGAVLGMTAHIAKSIIDLTSARTEAAKAPAIVTLAASAISQIQSQITQAIGDTNRGRPKVNGVNVGGPVASTYVPLAAAALREAGAFVDKAVINLRQASADESIANTYANLAATELAEARTHLDQAGGYFRVLTTRLEVANTMRLYQTWGESKLAVVMADLRRMRKPKTKHTYARD